MNRERSPDQRELAEAVAAFTLIHGVEGLARIQAESERTGRSPSDLILSWANLEGEGLNLRVGKAMIR